MRTGLITKQIGKDHSTTLRWLRKAQTLDLANVTVDHGTIVRYVFNMDGELASAEGPGHFIVLVANSTIDLAEFRFPEW